MSVYVSFRIIKQALDDIRMTVMIAGQTRVISREFGFAEAGSGYGDAYTFVGTWLDPAWTDVAAAAVRENISLMWLSSLYLPAGSRVRVNMVLS